jgi:HSP20 family protein
MFGNIRYYSRSASIYPGIYQPLQGKEPEMTNDEGISTVKPPVNIIDLPDHYRVEMPAPDFEKGDFFIMTNKCSLSIVAQKRHIIKGNEGSQFSHSFYDKIKAAIDLPADADTDFGTAEYTNGMLYIYVYRSPCPVQNRKSQIIVY